ncbi:hypothetical protein [Psychrobacter okhotskensis]|uniref:hypothetical protein n=1 Tax=Psychrobacter okhotskensis TaxID=212403 RepID=UPI00191873BE|nr:hypothetical protein [Psychrobacter okhotskensis]
MDIKQLEIIEFKHLKSKSNIKESAFSIESIAKLIKKSRDSGSPYTILTGAGCSKSAGIPLAGELVKEMNLGFDVQLSNLSKEDRDNYNKCMNALTHQERRELLQNHIQEANINWAHIGLAALMDNGYTQRVLTFNFDNILMRACGLIGLYPSIYDFTNADVNLQNLIIDPSIIYLHGQSYGFRQLNDENETKDHANNMTNFIAQTLNTSPVIVAGYSGYNDGFFEQIDKHYCGEQRLFWIGYEKEIPEHLRDFFKKYKNHAHYIGGQDADDFFVSLMQQLDCLPSFFTQHAQHTIKILDEVIDFPIPNTDGAINILSDLRQQMNKIGNEVLSLKAILHNLMMEGKYSEVISTVESSENQDTNNDEAKIEEIKNIYAWAQVNKASEDWALLKRDIDNIDIKVVDHIFKLFEQAESVLSYSYELYTVWGVFLSELAGLVDDVNIYESSISKLSKANKLNSSAPTAYYWGTNLLMLAELKDNFAYNQEALEKLLIAEKADPKNVYNLACSYIRLGDIEIAKSKLITCKENKTLPSKKILLKDSDMNTFYDTLWFEELVASLE